MFVSVFLNFLYLLFPLMCYFLYMVYSKAAFQEEKHLFLDLAIFTSYYLCIRFGKLPTTYVFLINIPLLIALYKKRIFPGIILSLCIPIILSSSYETNLGILFLQYFLIFIFCYLTNYKTINVFIFFSILFGILTLFLPNNIIDVNKLCYALVIWIIMYVLFHIIILLYAKVENTVRMYYSLESITKEKKLYESLFKITHEIKNPLAVCKGYLEMFDINNPKKANKYVNIINQEIDRTLLLLKDFSDVSKIHVEKNSMDITMLVEDVCDEASLAFNNNIKFKSNVPEDEIMINGDYNRLKQVLINLVKNARESIEDKGMVFLEAKVIGKYYCIYIRDNGVGMDKETSNKIGTAFYTTKKNGTGLGVCLSREIIERHNGSIAYFSKLKKGTTVKIMIPLNKASV